MNLISFVIPILLLIVGFVFLIFNKNISKIPFYQGAPKKRVRTNLIISGTFMLVTGIVLLILKINCK